MRLLSALHRMLLRPPVAVEALAATSNEFSEAGVGVELQERVANSESGSTGGAPPNDPPDATLDSGEQHLLSSDAASSSEPHTSLRRESAGLCDAVRPRGKSRVSFEGVRPRGKSRLSFVDGQLEHAATTHL